MKKIFRLGLLAVVLASFAFVFTSCSKDDDDVIKSDLIGKWVGTTTEVYSNGKPFLSFEDTHTTEKYASWEFKSNGTAEYIDKSTGTITKHETYTFSLIDNTIETINDTSKEKGYFEFEVKGNNLTLTSTSKSNDGKYTYILVQNFIRKK